jgi:hypothetical protein
MDPQPNIERMSLLSKSEITMGVVQKYFAMTDGEKSEYRNFLNLPSSFPDGYMDPEVIKVCKELVEFQSEHREELQLGEPPESDPPWVNIATRAENPGHWGFIGYRGFQSSDKEWDAVRDKFERLARSALEKDAFGLPTHDPNGVRFGATIEWQQGVFKGPKDART